MDDQHRPSYHFLPPANWMNDPNGLIQWGERYHLFYQYNPAAPVHHRIHWGHASSTDLVYWRHEPIALVPEADGPDASGCWSGCAVDDGGVPTLVYSGHRPGRLEAPCLATSTDNLQTWQKFAGNPLFETPPGLDLVALRDHTIWREAGRWFMAVGAGLRGTGGAALLFCSDDLRAWEYRGSLLHPDSPMLFPELPVEVWECPDLFPLDGRHVLLLSLWSGGPLCSAAAVGNYADERFRPTHTQRLDHGDVHFYAPQSFRDQGGRRIVFGWAMEGRSASAQVAAGWSGVMALPRELRLTDTGRLTMTPVEELKKLRGRHSPWRGLSIRPWGITTLPSCSGAAIELQLEIIPGGASAVGVVLRRSPDGSEETVVRYEADAGRLVVDRSRASLDPEVARSAHSAPLLLGQGEPLRLRLFLDHSLLEVFANDRAVITTRIYPAHVDSNGIGLFAEGQSAWLTALDLWQMRAIW